MSPECNAMDQEGGERIIHLSQPLHTGVASSWYDEADEHHFWMQWRFVATLKLLDELGVSVGLPLRALDLGCGNGGLISQLERVSAWTVDGAELDVEALRRCSSGRGRLFVYNVMEELAQMVDSYDLVFLYDVLEHITHTEPFLKSVVRHARPGGLVIINVPAIDCLRGGYDEAAGHLRRYSARSLKAEIEPLPATILCTRYWGMSLVPLVALRKLIGGRALSADEVIRSGFRPPNKIADAALRWAMRVETRILQQPPVGSSILLAARRSQ